MWEKIDIIFRTIETMAASCELKGMRLNAAAINILINKLSTDMHISNYLPVSIACGLYYFQIMCKIGSKTFQKMCKTLLIYLSKSGIILFVRSVIM